MAENSPAHDVFDDTDPELDADGHTEAVVAEPRVPAGQVAGAA